ncbi:hypothetical protein DL770_011575 [Monosporascus sp. CRB-9-2]|nr:hypothetical protein DL770_011575 [Monosporascus sp. CRB-9-2]
MSVPPGHLHIPNGADFRNSSSQARVRPSPPSDDDTSTAAYDTSDTSSVLSVPDTNNLGWKIFRVPDSATDTVYEAWEMLSVTPTNELRSKTKFLGLDLKANYAVARDGYTGVRAVPYYKQEELAGMVTAAQEAYSTGRSKRRFLQIWKRRSYMEDLTARLFSLPGSLPNRLGALLDTRYAATNKSQYARREWKVVFMKRIESAIAADSSHNCSKPRAWYSGRKQTQERGPIQKWLLVIRGQVTQTSESGFVAFDTATNPWLKTDQQTHREKAELRAKST